MILRFSDSELTKDATGIVSLSMVEPPTYENKLEIFGTKAAMHIDHRGAAFIADNKSNAWEQVRVPLGRNLCGMPDTGFPRGFLEFAPKIVGAIREGRASFEHAPTFEDGLKTQRVLDAARESDRLRSAIDPRGLMVYC
jgi:predicted dehydrogenase